MIGTQLGTQNDRKQLHIEEGDTNRTIEEGRGSVMAGIIIIIDG